MEQLHGGGHLIGRFRITDHGARRKHWVRRAPSLFAPAGGSLIGTSRATSAADDERIELAAACFQAAVPGRAGGTCRRNRWFIAARTDFEAGWIVSPDRQSAAGALAQAWRRHAAREARPSPVALACVDGLPAKLEIAADRRRRAAPSRAGPLADRSEERADVAIDRQSLVAISFRPRHRRYAERFRPHGGNPLASGVARLAGASNCNKTAARSSSFTG